MNWFRVSQARWGAVFRQANIEEEIDEELRFHLEMRTRENIARGLPAVEASLKARRRFGNFNGIKDACRDIRGLGALLVLWHDTRFAARMLLKDRAFTVVAVLALGLSIGANTAMYTVASRVLLRPLPYPESQRIMSIVNRDSNHPDIPYSLSYPDFVDYCSRAREFDSIGAYHSTTFAVIGSDGKGAQIQGAIVTAGLFPVLRVKPALGREFAPEEDEPGNRVAMITYDFWQTHYRGSPGVIDAPLLLDGTNYRVVGVMPRGFRFPLLSENAQVWTTMARAREAMTDGGPAYTTHRDAHFLGVLGRLKQDRTEAEAAASLEAIASDLAVTYPESNRRFDSCSVSPWLAAMTKSVRPPLLMLLGGALCLLCVACANIANLLLARGATRQREIAIRSALGAGRGRILRQLLTESLFLATIGGVVGLLVAVGGIHYIGSVLPPDFPRLAEIGPDAGVLAFTAVITCITSCFFGLVPAWRSARCELAPLLNDCSRGSTETPRGRRLRSFLVVTEMVFAFVLLSGACFLLRGLHRLENVTPGFDPRNLLTAKVVLPDNRNPEMPAITVTFYQELLKRVSELPGVRAASATAALPLSGYAGLAQFYVAGRSMDESNLPRAEPWIVTPHYFQTMGIPLVRGRDFEERDDRDAPGVVIINESFARTFFENENPVGRRITPTITDSSVPFLEREIIGIVGDVKSGSLSAEDKPQMYVPHPQCAALEMTLVLRGDGPFETLFGKLENVVREMDKGLPFEQRRTMKQYIAASVAQPRLNSTVLSIFAAVALVLTAVGVYGVMAYSAAQRGHEIGIRIALGAQRLSVFRLLMRNGVQLLGLSILAGCVCTLLATRFLPGFAYGLAGSEASTLLLVSLMLSGVALAACWIPAHRATEVDPLALLGQR